MQQLTSEQIEAAKALGVSLRVGDSPTTVAKLVELVLELQQRVAALERHRSRWGGL